MAYRPLVGSRKRAWMDKESLRQRKKTERKNRTKARKQAKA